MGFFILCTKALQGMDSFLNLFSDRINRIVRIERPSAEGPLAASEKNPVNPAENPPPVWWINPV